MSGAATGSPFQVRSELCLLCVTLSDVIFETSVFAVFPEEISLLSTRKQMKRRECVCTVLSMMEMKVFLVALPWLLCCWKTLKVEGRPSLSVLRHCGYSVASDVVALMYSSQEASESTVTVRFSLCFIQV